MSEKTWTTENKGDWGAGEWQSEPDKVQWVDAETGLPCLIVRGPVGALCGYVAVSPGHPWYKLHYDDETVQVDVHGGLTFADHCQDTKGDESRGVCHMPEPGAPDNVWWFGFDCSHAGDLSPSMEVRYSAKSRAIFNNEYRNLSYVKSEVTNLARQIANRLENISPTPSCGKLQSVVS